MAQERHERNLETMRRAAADLRRIRTEFLCDRSARIEEVISSAEEDSTVSIEEFLVRLRGLDRSSRNTS